MSERAEFAGLASFYEENTGRLLDVCIYITAYLLIFVKLAGLAGLPIPAACNDSKSQDIVGGVNIPNQLSKEAIESFKAIYEAEFNETLTDDEAQEGGMRLLQFFDVLNRVEAAPLTLPEAQGSMVE